MGQANAARDKLYDLRECKLGGVKGNEYDLSGVIMSKTDVSNGLFREAQFSKGYLRDSNFDNADFTNAIVDRASFMGSSLRGTIFSNAVLTATSFEGADVGESVKGAVYSSCFSATVHVSRCCAFSQFHIFPSHTISPDIITTHGILLVRKRRLYGCLHVRARFYFFS